ncbi:MAG: phage tail tube protein [Vallitalea sp.]|jgi:hypothetical protein|nr:phage tail tube protein [Vallitalea sp.]
MAILQAQDIISGREGKVFKTINGIVKEMAYIKKIDAKIEKNKSEIKVLGSRATHSKATGWKGTGSMTIYYMTSEFRQLMLDYIKTGKDVYFDIQLVNEDPASSAGKQTVVLKNCNIDSVIIGQIDIDKDVLEEELSFTFDDIEILNKFNVVE